MNDISSKATAINFEQTISHCFDFEIEKDLIRSQLLTMLAVMSEPNNIDIYFDPNNGGFARKYSKYLEELQKLTPASQAITVARKEENQATSRTNQP